jgi:hypothetical protein
MTSSDIRAAGRDAQRAQRQRRDQQQRRDEQARLDQRGPAQEAQPSVAWNAAQQRPEQ